MSNCATEDKHLFNAGRSGPKVGGDQSTKPPVNSLEQPPLIVHIIRRLAVGGLENGLVNLINYMPSERYRHAIICLKDSTDFRDRLRRTEVPVVALRKQAGQDLGVHARLWKVLRNLRPDVVHTRNLPGLEYLMPAALAGVRCRIHGEHGRDMYDLDGLNAKYNLLRKAMRPLVHHYIAVSSHLAHWLVDTVGADAYRVTRIYNGVDLQRFRLRTGPRRAAGPAGFAGPETFIVGTVGRMEGVKDQLTLVRGFLNLLKTDPVARNRVRLMLIGDGALLGTAREMLRTAGAEHLAWLPGERSDVPEIMRSLDLFVLPSLREGISNTILEAMATGLPVVATRVGGNPELVEEGHTGTLVPPADPVAMAAAIRTYFANPDKVILHGQSGRKRVEKQFSMEAMVDGYLAVYDAVLNRKRQRAAGSFVRRFGLESNSKAG